MNLDKKQQKVVDMILNREVNSLYLTGEGGSGKSEIIKQIAEQGMLIGRRVLLLAPTNEAAKNIGGVTLHKAFGLALEVDEDADKHEDLHHTRIDEEKLTLKFRELNLKPSDIIVIDEISMGGSLLSKVLKMLRTFEKGNGGLSTLLLVGDPAQLPPVKDRVIDWGKRCNKTVTLTKNYRTNNPDLREIITRFRDTQDKSIVNDLPTVKSFLKLDYDPKATYIAFKNDTLAQMQSHMLGKTETWLKKGDIVTSFGTTDLHYVLERDKRTNELGKLPYFTTGTKLEIMSKPKPFLGIPNLYVYEVNNPEYKELTVYDKDEDWPEKIQIVSGDYRARENEKRVRFSAVNKYKKELFKKYAVQKVYELKRKWNGEERKKWGQLWRQYFQIASIPFARHSAFTTAYKAQGRSIPKVIVMWDEMKDDKQRYVAISRAKDSLTLVTKSA